MGDDVPRFDQTMNGTKFLEVSEVVKEVSVASGLFVSIFVRGGRRCIGCGCVMFCDHRLRSLLQTSFQHHGQLEMTNGPSLLPISPAGMVHRKWHWLSLISHRITYLEISIRLNPFSMAGSGMNS